ncbi:MAG TPA: hypothetical protein ENI29_01630 [bacterium]|nr:hypothetical protein [bacterium]
MTDFIQQTDQSIYIVDEESYGEHYDPESEHNAWVAISAAFPHVIPVNIITDSFDYEIPKILKEKLFSIGGGKYPALIANTIQEPVEISFETKMQHPIFLTYAVGTVASTGTRAEEVTITCPAESGNISQGDYFLINGIDGSGEEHFAVWMDTAGDTSSGKPTIAGIAADHVLPTNLSVNTPNNTPTQVATAVAAILHADGAFTDNSSSGADVKTTMASSGAVRDARDSGVASCGITVSVTQQGVNTHTITESTGYSLPSLTMHIEQRNSTPVVKESAADGVTVAAGKTFTSAGATFSSSGVAAGHLLCIDEGTQTGKYLIISVDSENQVTVAKDSDFLATTSLDFRVLDTEDVIVDLFGCVVTDYELTIDYGDKIVSESVTLKCVNYSLGDRLTNPPPKVELIDPHTWVDLKESASNYLLQEGTTDKTPDIVNKAILKISNDVEFQPELESRYPQTAMNGKREVSLQLVGFTKNRDTFDYFNDTWDNTNQRYSSASGRLNSKIRLERNITYDYMLFSIYNWLIEEHNHNVFSIDDRIKGLDLTFTAATPDINLRIIDSFSIVDFLSDTCYQNSFS